VCSTLAGGLLFLYQSACSVRAETSRGANPPGGFHRWSLDPVERFVGLAEGVGVDITGADPIGVELPCAMEGRRGGGDQGPGPRRSLPVCCWHSQSGLQLKMLRSPGSPPALGGARVAPEPMQFEQRRGPAVDECSFGRYPHGASTQSQVGLKRQGQTRREAGAQSQGGSPSASKPGYRRRWDG